MEGREGKERTNAKFETGVSTKIKNTFKDII